MHFLEWYFVPHFIRASFENPDYQTKCPIQDKEVNKSASQRVWDCPEFMLYKPKGGKENYRDRG